MNQSQLDEFIEKEFTKMSKAQLDVLDEGLKESVNILYYLNSAYSVEQMKVILSGLVLAKNKKIFSENIVTKICNPTITAEKMTEILNSEIDRINAREVQENRLFNYARHLYVIAALDQTR